MKRVVSALPSLVTGLLAILLGRMWIEGQIVLFAVIIGMALILTGLVYVVGSAVLRDYPSVGSLFMESGQGAAMLVAAIVGGGLLWLGVTYAPGSQADEKSKQTWAAIMAAVAAYLGAVVIKPELPWNPVKSALVKQFRGAFTSRRDPIEKDAHDAWLLPTYGAQAASELVDGWGWDARRLRARHIQRAVNRGYLEGPPPDKSHK